MHVRVKYILSACIYSIFIWLKHQYCRDQGDACGNELQSFRALMVQCACLHFNFAIARNTIFSSFYTKIFGTISGQNNTLQIPCTFIILLYTF